VTTVTPRSMAEIMRDEMTVRPRIAALLADGPKTIPEIAEALHEPAPEVTLWVMALRRYGVLEELPKPKVEDYYRYRLAGETI
jgi:predicted Rossmann fold nucleotide-binding protein DprA/Smf involved in DNA uptake